MSVRRILRSSVTAVLLVALATVAAMAGGSATLGARSSHPAATHLGYGHIGALAATPKLQVKLTDVSSQAPTDAFCRANFGTPCYSPQEIRHAYGVDQLLSRGDDGAGETVVIIDSYGSPTITSDLASFDAGYGLPAPPSFRILSPLGTVPFDPTAIPDQIGWAAETTLDVEWSHAMAPDASIVLLTSPVDETEGVQGLPQFNYLLNYALNHHLGQVISQSWAATENTLFTPAGEQVLQSMEHTYERAAFMGVTVLAAAGDGGSANPALDGTIYPYPTVNFPASSPFVTAVGGTSLYADTSGNYQSETVWNSDGGAGGGGISQVFGEPLYQRFLLPPATQKELGGYRGVPDVSWNADPSTSILIYLSFFGASSASYYAIGGTSEGSPQWAGLVSDLDQLARHPVGFLNPYLYALGAAGIGFHDITVGNNSIGGVPGYSAAPGWDPASGWGTPDLGQLFGDIAALAHGDRSVRSLLAGALHLRHAGT